MAVNCTIIRSQDGLRGDQNRPNPFSNTTYINYECPETEERAIIMIFDQQGKTVKTYDNLKVGKGELQVNKGSLPSGLYLYKLLGTRGASETKEMIIQ